MKAKEKHATKESPSSRLGAAVNVGKYSVEDRQSMSKNYNKPALAEARLQLHKLQVTPCADLDAPRYPCNSRGIPLSMLFKVARASCTQPLSSSSFAWTVEWHVGHGWPELHLSVEH